MPPRARIRRPPRPGALADLAPARILRQILTLQALYYASAMLLMVFTAFVAGRHPSVELLLGWQHLRGDVTDGWMYGLDWLLVSLVTYVPPSPPPPLPRPVGMRQRRRGRCD